MAKINVGEMAPDFSLPGTGTDEMISLSRFRGQKVILYFYAKDNTVGCSTEAREFRDIYKEITALGAVVLGVSRDSITTHEKFKAKENLPFVLLSDSDNQVGNTYGVLTEKTQNGKKKLGVERTTVIIDETGVIIRIMRKVKAAGHAGQVGELLRTLSESEK